VGHAGYNCCVITAEFSRLGLASSLPCRPHRVPEGSKALKIARVTGTLERALVGPK